jgi:hypothetical protein
MIYRNAWGPNDIFSHAFITWFLFACLLFCLFVYFLSVCLSFRRVIILFFINKTIPMLVSLIRENILMVATEITFQNCLTFPRLNLNTRKTQL